MKISEIHLDENQRELTVRGEPGYPVAMYDIDMLEFLGGNVPWHWHREIEFNIVRRGYMTVETGGQRVTLRSGQGSFLNSGVLHRMYRGDAPDCKMLTIAFDPLLISGSETSVYHRSYIIPLIQCPAVPTVWLTGEAPWHSEALEKLEQAFEVYESGSYLCELTVRNLLSDVWAAILLACRDHLSQSVQEPKDQRLKIMLQHLRAHFVEPVRLEDVAASAGVSVRECTRCFRRTLGITPIAYLMQLRIRAAAAKLESTDASITEIGLSSGFESASYFAAMFRQHTGLSPRDYRKSKL